MTALSDGDAVQLACALAGSLCRQRRCWPMFDDMVGAGLLRREELRDAFDPAFGADERAFLAQRMRLAMIDYWRSVSGLNRSSGTFRRTVSLDAHVKIDEDHATLGDLISDPVDCIERWHSGEEAARVLRRTRRLTNGDMRVVFDSVLAGTPRSVIAEGLGVTPSRVAQHISGIRRRAERA